jgi:hypothetical protein
VRWPPSCEEVRSGAEESALLSQLRVAVMRSDKFVTDAVDSSETE